MAFVWNGKSDEAIVAEIAELYQSNEGQLTKDEDIMYVSRAMAALKRRGWTEKRVWGACNEYYLSKRRSGEWQRPNNYQPLLEQRI